jgi:hypothetical protein
MQAVWTIEDRMPVHNSYPDGGCEDSLIGFVEKAKSACGSYYYAT